ncbi:hypothetical protein BCR32DRAFT_276804 [Anaeromyces robustus]|uniref:Uncharacterized protein n=1 Tax=Anaeromyces robustus TaxID=1754192 RepID=A0A1Y1XGI5_9FUNG|nr:hypothetical protein BCR32DRAFT_276804 [Anaeromyces robustus]|eukprot:ORX84833.1 hypothetical protein BCR32DRAFT_276804 [Anaeromyces robustus]
MFSFTENLLVEYVGQSHFNNKLVKKDIIKCYNYNFADLQNFVISMTKDNDIKSIPNDGIIITDGRSSTRK